MNDKKLIAQALLEIAKNSTTELIEDAKIDKEIVDAAKKMGMIIPSPDFAIFKTIWAEINKKNLNNVYFSYKAVEEGIQTLVGKNLNFEHQGAYNVCGFCLSVKHNDKEIECIQVFYKSLYPDKFEELKEKIKTKEAAVSFEIYNKIDGKSVVKELEDGTKEITKIHCHGTGLLLINPPACPKAKIFKLVANKEIQEAEKIVDKVFSEDLIYAQMAIEEPNCINCGKCNYIKEKEENKVELAELYVNVTKEEDITFEIAMAFYYSSDEDKTKLTEDAAKWTRKFINSLPDSAFAAIEPAYPEKTEDKNCRHLPHHNGEGDLGKEKDNKNIDKKHLQNALARVNQIVPVTDSISTEDLRTKAENHLNRHKDVFKKSSEETKPIDETKPVDAGAETKPEGEETKEVAQPLEVVEPKIIVKVTRIYSETTIDTYIDGTPSGTQEVKGYSKKVTEYKDGTKDEVEEEVKIEKKYTFAELEEKVNAAKSEKDTEIATLKAEHERVLAEKDTEIKNKIEELGKKDQEIVELKTPKVEIAKEKDTDLNVGNVEHKEAIKEIQSGVNKKAFPQKKTKR